MSAPSSPAAPPGDRGRANPLAGARFLLSCARLAQLPDDARPEIAFAGRSNAGKSSALNALCGQAKLARVSKTPGRTQLINLFEVGGGRFADLPGYGYAKVPKDISQAWGQLIGSYLQKRANLRAIVQIMDIRHPLTDFDVQMLEWAAQRGLACLVLLSKADKLSFGAAKTTLLRIQKALAATPAARVLRFSAVSGLGLAEARDTLAAWLAAPPS